MLFLRVIIFSTLTTCLFSEVSHSDKGKIRLKAGSSIKVDYLFESNKLLLNWNALPLGIYKLTILNQEGIAIYKSKVSGNLKLIPANKFEEGHNYTITLEGKIKGPTKKSFVFSARVKTPEIEGNVKVTNAGGRKGRYYLPKNYRLKSLPLMFILHGSSINGRKMVNLFRAEARKNDFIIVAPDSSDIRGWEISTDLNDPSADQVHIYSVLNEVSNLPGVNIDKTKVLIVGVSAGGALSALQGSNDEFFTAFAVLHGGVLEGSIGSNYVPVWLSTGSQDTLRTPKELLEYKDTLSSLGFLDVTYQEYDYGHEVLDSEKQNLLEWWLNNDTH